MEQENYIIEENLIRMIFSQKHVGFSEHVFIFEAKFGV
jgi:hypothetical protein